MNDFLAYNCNITKILNACYVSTDIAEKTHKNRYAHGLVFYMHDGEKTYVFSDGKIITVTAGDILYLPKYSSYETFSESPGNCYAINFDLDEDVTFEPFAFHTKNKNEIKQLFIQTSKSWNAKTIGHIEKCKALLYNILVILIREYWSEYLPSQKHQTISKAVDYIHHNYLTEQIRIDFLAEMCQITSVYFRKIFKSIYGVSPIKYINNLKIEHARELIESQMYSITEVAYHSGYSDSSSFSRDFKKHFGISPNEYAKGS